MKISSIIIWHVLATVIFVACYAVSLLIWPELDGHRTFSIATAAIFAALSLFVTIPSAMLVDNKNPYYFSWVTMFSVLIKLGIGMAIVVYYTRSYELDDRLYVISFILAYVIYTVCEVWILQRIINSSKKTWSN